MPVSDHSPLRATFRLSEALLSAASPEAVGAALMEELQAALGVDQVHLTEVSQDGDVGQGTVGGSDEPVYRQWLGGPSLITRVIDAGVSVAVADAPGDPTLRQDLVERFSAASLLGVPLRWGDEVRFVVVGITHERRAFEPHEIELAETLANQAAIALALLEAERSRAATRRAGRRADPRGDRPQRVSGARRGAGDPEPRGRPRGRRLAGGRLPRRRLGRRRRHGGPQHAGGLEGHRDGARRGHRRARAGDRAGLRHQRLPGGGRASPSPRPAAAQDRRRAADGVERRAQGRAVGRLRRDAAGHRRRPAHARGDRRPRGGRLPQRRGLRARQPRRDHRRPHRAAQSRGAAPAHPRGDLALPPHRHRR